MKIGYPLLPLTVLAVLLLTVNGFGRTMPKAREFNLHKPAAGVPNTINATHRISNIWFTVTNWGFLGSAQDPNIIDCETGLAAPSCEFPGGSELEYLFQGALWIGAIVDGDTLVSCGTDGWWDSHEFFPDVATDSTGKIWLGSTRPEGSYPRTMTDCYPDQFDIDHSISEEDFTAYYADTNVTYADVDPIDQRPLQPIGLQVEQKSYSWSYDYAEDFIIFDFKITNIGSSPINDMWVAFHIDADVHHRLNSASGAQDDMTGFLQKFKPIDALPEPIDIKTAYIMDNDGDPSSDGTWDNKSVRSCTGVRVVRVPEGSDSIGFNWWISNINSNLDWGPQHMDNYHGPWPGGGNGTPGGDPARYLTISNREFDYDQAYAAIDYSGGDSAGTKWIPPLPSTNAKDIANGYDTRYTYSFGPFETIQPGDSLLLTVAYIGGEDVHVNPNDYKNIFEGNETDTSAIHAFINSLDFTDFAVNATWAEWVYDNPGVDTDGDGDSGKYVCLNDSCTDRIWIKGDGVPDFAGPPPPPSPELTFETEPNNVNILWDGEKSEHTPDLFSGEVDFEGYKIYRSRSGVLNDFTLLGSYDRIDYDSLAWDPVNKRMKLSKKSPMTLGELLTRADTSSSFRFVVDLKPPYTPIICPDTTIDGTTYKWFIPHGYNIGCYEDTVFTQDTTGVGALGLGGIIPDSLEIHSAIYDSTVVALDPNTGDSIDINYYTFSVDSVLSSVPYYYAVTSFDYGNPVTGLSPLESSKAINMRAIYAIGDFDHIESDIYVYPNPYILDGRYRNQGWENVNEDPAYSQRIYFTNLPGKCTIRIFTLDGDLVDKIEFDPSDSDQPIASWDLISRNTQSIVSGIYLYSVDYEGGRQMGKFVIIK